MIPQSSDLKLVFCCVLILKSIQLLRFFENLNRFKALKQDNVVFNKAPEPFIAQHYSIVLNIHPCSFDDMHNYSKSYAIN